MLGVSVGVPFKVQTAQPENRPLGQTETWIGCHHVSNWIPDLLWTMEIQVSAGNQGESVMDRLGTQEATKARGAVKARGIPRPKGLRKPGGPMGL